MFDIAAEIDELMKGIMDDAQNQEQILASVAPFYRMSYRQYLQTDYWKAKRKGILTRDKRRCRDCGAKKRLQVHHKTYAALRGRESDCDLITVCAECHRFRHKEIIPGARRRTSW